ncbi:MAG: DUF86 domain-containing protein [Oscillospiraceae bacterium]|jgi:uncharacterized protein with HEPN domain|nr:DUF86 domain-containing protein [Oscillospiraceae bacterium]
MADYDKDMHIITHIVAYCDEIEVLTERFGKTQEAFKADFAYRNACAMSILQIGELAAHLSDSFRNRYDGVPWKLIRAMRNVFAHDYNNMNIAQTWATITSDIPQLSVYCNNILRLHDRKDNE